ncbi:MAG: hypothetical protein JWP35_1974 [Caulobacter sp.]|nr:hypothetical protein [Caulobacter sp.]
MPLDFTGRTAVVFGAEGDLGRAVARHLEAGGAAVYADGPQTPLSEPATRDLVERAMAERGAIDILVHARESAPAGGLAATSDAAFGEALRRHAHSALWALQAALPHMREANYGRILALVSGIGVYGAEQDVAHAAAHAGVAALTRSVAQGNLDRRIRANVLAPVALTTATAAFFDEQAQLDRALFGIGDVLAAVGHLCHADCAANGETFSAGGGRFAQLFTGATLGIFDPTLTDGGFGAALEKIRDARAHIAPRGVADELVTVAV